MFGKAILVVLVCSATLAAGNPAAGVKVWRWKPRAVTVSPNANVLPFARLMDTYRPQIFVPGTKTVAGCGPVSKSSNTRIVGGEEADPHSYPWQVALFIDDMYFCGGTIISEDTVMTAAHCMAGARSVEVVAGAHNVRLNEPTQVSQVSTDFFVHEDWVSIIIKNDISIIKLPTPYTWTDAIAPACLPARSDPELPPGTLVNPSGWGKTKDYSLSISDTLNDVVVPVDSQTHCSNYYGSTVVTDDIICINTAGGKGTCNGDSGGPMNYITGGSSYVRGIVSFGSSAGCESGAPDAFTRVTHYLDWIETNTGIIIDH